MKHYLIPLLASLCIGCATQADRSNSQAQVPSGSEALLLNAYRLIDAFNNGDNKTWNELRCGATKNADVWGLAASKFLGQFSSPRLVSISSVSKAGNSAGKYQWPEVVIEVKATGYPVGNLLLKFIEDKGEKCVGLLY
jgi:hypothetical protein